MAYNGIRNTAGGNIQLRIWDCGMRIEKMMTDWIGQVSGSRVSQAARRIA